MQKSTQLWYRELHSRHAPRAVSVEDVQELPGVDPALLHVGELPDVGQAVGGGVCYLEDAVLDLPLCYWGESVREGEREREGGRRRQRESQIYTGFFIDTNTKWSCGRTVHFIDMRSFANCS